MPVGVDRLHLLDQGEDAVELIASAFGFRGGDIDAGQLRDAVHVVQGQGHA